MNKKLEKTEEDVLRIASIAESLCKEIEEIERDIEALKSDCAIVDVIRAVYEKNSL